jgi:hypothetical protein
MLLGQGLLVLFHRGVTVQILCQPKKNSLKGDWLQVIRISVIFLSYNSEPVSFKRLRQIVDPTMEKKSSISDISMSLEQILITYSLEENGVGFFHICTNWSQAGVGPDPADETTCALSGTGSIHWI